MENLYEISTIRNIMERHGFSFSKRLGQNFLTDPTVCPRIAEQGGAAEGTGVIEVGAGVGVLTHELAKRADKVCSIELDRRLIPVLDETLAEHDNVRVVNDDILKIDLRKLIAEQFDGLRVVVCANLPYYITSPVIMRLLEEHLPIEAVTVMVQKEAAARLTAQCGSRECGAVTFAVRYYSEPRRLFNVSRGCFYPSPNVDSAVVRFDIKPRTDTAHEQEIWFFRVVKAAFAQRRKTLCNSVSSALGMDKNTVSAAALSAALDPAVRPENLTMQQMQLFASCLSENVK